MLVKVILLEVSPLIGLSKSVRLLSLGTSEKPRVLSGLR